MDFDTLQLVWDSQKEKPLYTIDEAALHASVRRCRDEEHHRTAWSYAVEIAGNSLAGFTTLALAAAAAWADPAWLDGLSWVTIPVTAWHAAGLALAGALWLQCAITMWTARRRQMQREESYASTLQGDLERALAHLAFQTREARTILWWGLIPAWTAAGLFCLILFHIKSSPPWAYPVIGILMAIALAFTLRHKARAIATLYEPRRRELETLRAKLLDGQR